MPKFHTISNNKVQFYNTFKKRINKFYFIFMSRNRRVSAPEMPKAQVEVFTKEEFNFKRNNSYGMSTCLTWGLPDEEEDYIEDDYQARNRSIPVGSQSEMHEGAKQGDGSGRSQTQKSALKGQENRQKAQSAVKKNQPGKSQPKKDYSKFQKTPQQIEQQKKKAQQRKQKIQTYIESMIPYSRTFTDSRFQHLYQKSAPMAYGNGNTNQPIGGVIYGTNLRSFNVNPHDYQNNPKTYQSHTTSLNFAHRMKRDESKHWKRLEKELGKKLNLHEKNHTLEEGKQVVYVDVNDDNMHQIMRENLEFKKEHRDEIRQEENNYEHQKEMKSRAEKEKFYREKAQRTQQNLERTRADTVVCDRDPNGRLREQVIYKHTDKDGNVRLGADRHALTCFVDINFPENDQLYTQELKKRNQIFPIEVEDRHKNLAAHKVENYQKSLSNVYPSHYLLPCNDQPEIQKMLMEKSKQLTQEKNRRRN